ncbi:MAG: PHP domain-containing protein [Gemmatimonadaceae bacterium]|nr:PHP domain-containing protein [Gemmatimonadaceae bacterium]
MESRAAAHVLTEIATLRQLGGHDDATTAAFLAVARELSQGGVRPLAPSPAHADPLVAAVLADLVATGESALLDHLREETPEGLQALLRVPGLGPVTLHRLHAGLGVSTLADLEEAVRDGRVAALPHFGARTADRVRKAIAQLRATGAPVLLPHADAEAARLSQAIVALDGVASCRIAGDVARRRETITELRLVVACTRPPVEVATRIAALRGVTSAHGIATASVTLHFADATTARVECVPRAQLVLATWRATGSDEHVRSVLARLAERGVRVQGGELRDASGTSMMLADDAALYALAGLAHVPAELREGAGEVEAAAEGTLPHLIELPALRGVLHCHSSWSDGGSSIDALARAAHARGWRYLGISDHSRSALNAGGLSAEDVRRQHDEIDAVNAAGGARARVLKGIEADILPCGRVDYDATVLDRFDYVIASVHTRFGLNAAQMTERVCKALDDPHVTILGHPTGRLLLTREPYALDMPTVLAHAAARGVAVELNADPHRLDLDWRWCRAARDAGATIVIGPDAHSLAGLDNVTLGIDMARKGWLEAGDVLNTRDSDDVLAFARRRRAAALQPA